MPAAMMVWDDIESVEGFMGLQSRVDRDVIPAFEAMPGENTSKQGVPKGLGGVMTAGSVLFILSFGTVALLLPDNWWGIVLTLIAFFGLFFASFAAVLYFNRGKIGNYMGRAAERVVVRAKAMTAICEHIGLEYVAMPGGPSRSFMILADQKWAPPKLKAFAETTKTMGGMDEAVNIAKAAGLMQENVVVLGSEETRRKFKEAGNQNVQVEDGFSGKRSGIAFEAFEWIEAGGDADDIYHLTIVLTAPLNLHGVTGLRARKLSWLAKPDGVQLEAVDLGPKAFDAKYRLRASDQTEARTLFNPAVIERVITLAHGEPFRAVARDKHLIFDFNGANRFELMDVRSGAWDDDSLRKGITDIAEMLALVDTLAHSFMVKRDG